LSRSCARFHLETAEEISYSFMMPYRTLRAARK
jgi:hypothetical protein